MKAIIISASSDIGAALAKQWRKVGWDVTGTFRTPSLLVDELKSQGTVMLECNLSSISSIEGALDKLKEISWDVLVFAPGNLEPVGDFKDVNFDEWEEGIQINLLRQLRLLHGLLPSRRSNPKVLFFAGGGTNNAVLHYSSYTLSKIALIKMCELLDAEIPDTRFIIVGPGVVKTKIHEPTFKNREKVGQNYARTLERLAKNACTPMENVVACCHWLVTTSCNAVRGRNFSVVGDKWGTQDLEEALEKDFDMYKLRRYKNEPIPIITVR